jgi:hypothetical protein
VSDTLPSIFDDSFSGRPDPLSPARAEARPERLIRRGGNGDLFDAEAGVAVSADVVADLVCLGERVCIFDEKAREDRTDAILGPLMLARGRGGLAPTVDGVVLARVMATLKELHGQFKRMGDRITTLEDMLDAALLRPAAIPPPRSAAPAQPAPEASNLTQKGPLT